MAIALQEFADGERLAEALANRIAALLRAGCEAHGHAVLAVSGGTTPGRLFEILSRQELPWEKVTVTLVDERFVSPENERSNERLVALKLLQNHAAHARFVGLFSDAGNVDAAAIVASNRIAELPRPFDAVILGMGGDGHTASFFPQGDRLDEAIDPDGRALVLPMRAPGAGEARLTLTLPLVAKAGFVALHIEGEQKKATLEAALEPGPLTAMPVRAVIEAAPRPVDVYWAP